MDHLYCVYSSGPMDHFDGYVHVSDITEHFERFIKNNPRSNFTFDDLWHQALNKLYWAWTKCKYIDLNLRQPDFWIRMIRDGVDTEELFVIFKADNNGTMYAVVNKCFDHHDNVKKYLFHEFENEWELVKDDR